MLEFMPVWHQYTKVQGVSIHNSQGQSVPIPKWTAIMDSNSISWWGQRVEGVRVSDSALFRWWCPVSFIKLCGFRAEWDTGSTWISPYKSGTMVLTARRKSVYMLTTQNIPKLLPASHYSKKYNHITNKQTKNTENEDICKRWQALTNICLRRKWKQNMV